MDPVSRGLGTQADPFGWGIVLTPSAFGMPANTLLLTANRATFNRAIGFQAITKIGIEVTTQAGNLDVGVYAGASGFGAPGSRRGSAGATACPAAAYVEISLTASTGMQAGDYLAISADAAPCTVLVGSQSQTDSNIGKGINYHQSSAYVLPTSAGATAGRGAAIFMLGVP